MPSSRLSATVRFRIIFFPLLFSAFFQFNFSFKLRGNKSFSLKVLRENVLILTFLLDFRSWEGWRKLFKRCLEVSLVYIIFTIRLFTNFANLSIVLITSGYLLEINIRRMILRDGLKYNSRVISVPFRCSFRHALVKCNHSAARTVPYSDPPSSKDVNQLHEFIDRRWEL